MLKKGVTQRVSNTQHTLADDKQPVFFEGLFVCDALNHTLAAHLCVFFLFFMNHFSDWVAL